MDYTPLTNDQLNFLELNDIDEGHDRAADNFRCAEETFDAALGSAELAWDRNSMEKVQNSQFQSYQYTKTTREQYTQKNGMSLFQFSNLNIPVTKIIHSAFKIPVKNANVTQNALKQFLEERKQIGAIEAQPVIGNYNSSDYELKELTTEGFLFEKSDYAVYRLRFVYLEEEAKKNLWFVCDCLEGSAFLVSRFWNDVKQNLVQKQIYEDESMLEEEENFSDSDWDEEEGDSFDLELLQECHFLQLDQDPTIFKEWLQELKHPNFLYHTILLMAWNLRNVANMVVFVSHSYTQLLFDSLVDLLQQQLKQQQQSLVVSRSCATILFHLMKYMNQNQKKNIPLSVSQQNVQTIIETLVGWSGIHKQKQSEEQIVSKSEQVIESLSFAVVEMVEKKLVDKKELGPCISAVKQICQESQNCKHCSRLHSILTK